MVVRGLRATDYRLPTLSCQLGRCIMFAFSLKAGRARKPILAPLLLIVILTLGTTCGKSQGAAPSHVHIVAGASDPSPVLAGLLDRFFSFLSTTLSSQARMLQLGIIGMCIGLYILMRK